MFMVSRDGSEDLYAHASSYEMEVDGDLVFYDDDQEEVGRVVAFGSGEGNAVVLVDPEAVDEDELED